MGDVAAGGGGSAGVREAGKVVVDGNFREVVVESFVELDFDSVPAISFFCGYLRHWEMAFLYGVCDAVPVRVSCRKPETCHLQCWILNTKKFSIPPTLGISHKSGEHREESFELFLGVLGLQKKRLNGGSFVELDFDSVPAIFFCVAISDTWKGHFSMVYAMRPLLGCRVGRHTLEETEGYGQNCARGGVDCGLKIRVVFCRQASVLSPYFGFGGLGSAFFSCSRIVRD